MIEQTTAAETAIPEDYKAYTAFRDAGGNAAPAEDDKAPVAGEENTPQSEPADEAGEIAEESDTEEDSQQDDEEDDDEQDDEDQEEDAPAKPKTGRGQSKRFKKLTGRIKALESRLAEQGIPADGDEEDAEEVVSSPDDAEKPAAETKPVRPHLHDFEDTEDKSAWDQYEEARERYEEELEEYLDKKADRKIQTALEKQSNELNLKHAKEAADAAWNKAAGRYSDYNEVVTNPDVKISAAMEATMRLEPEDGTALAYYLGQHPEESERIAQMTLAQSPQEWPSKLALAAKELGKLLSKTSVPGKKASGPPGVETGKKPAPVAPPQPKKVSSAHKPPTIIRGGKAAPTASVTDEDQAANYAKWKATREAQLRKR